mmetsp:Transcript_3958/g.9557  ORF Transcript_3958/g.9557 Transcript_3958/m.9557 type:complete len:82 (-) Transcript_3958:99-344(-)
MEDTSVAMEHPEVAICVFETMHTLLCRSCAEQANILFDVERITEDKIEAMVVAVMQKIGFGRCHATQSECQLSLNLENISL